jgi:hypothetical protein
MGTVWLWQWWSTFPATNNGDNNVVAICAVLTVLGLIFGAVLKFGGRLGRIETRLDGIEKSLNHGGHRGD